MQFIIFLRNAVVSEQLLSSLDDAIFGLVGKHMLKNEQDSDGNCGGNHAAHEVHKPGSQEPQNQALDCDDGDAEFASLGGVHGQFEDV